MHFNFENVLDKNITQEEVYKNYFKNLINSTFEGVSGTIFTYG